MKRTNIFRILSLILVLTLLLPASVSCSDEQGIDESDFQAEISEAPTNYVLMEITYTSIDRKEVTGKVVIELCPDIAPITAKNFQDLVGQGFYDGLTFHRVYKGFMIQGGDPDGDGSGGSPNTIKGEFAANGYENSLSHTRGVVSMARNSLSYDSASSQFFIVHEDSTFLDGDYAAFGRVIYGMSTVDGIAKTQVKYNSGGEKSSPVNPVTINFAKFVTVSGDAVTTTIQSTIHSTVDLSAVEPSVSTTAATTASTPSTQAPTVTTAATVPTTSATASTSTSEPTPTVQATTTVTSTTSDGAANEPLPTPPSAPTQDEPDFSALSLSDYTVTSTATELVLITVSYTDEYDVPHTGQIVLRLFDGVAPLTVAHIQALVAQGAYNDAKIDRIVKGTALYGGITDCATVKGEFSQNNVPNSLSHIRGVVSMVRDDAYDSATGRFFILQRAYPECDGSYAAFGFVAYGMDVIDAISNTPLQFDPVLMDRTLPVTPVIIRSMQFLTAKTA